MGLLSDNVSVNDYVFDEGNGIETNGHVWVCRITTTRVLIVQLIHFNSKCEKYWPSSDDPDDDDMDRGDDSTGSNTRSSKKAIPSMQFGDIAIELVSEEAIESEFIIRELKLIKGDSHHSLTQYHFIQWPDFGCPQNPYSLIHLIEFSVLPVVVIH
ncbi:unnamed protein product [Oppiella nova]|uniref:Tyrosine-protein phosphatase domain-containing protein n=1 Tax=Oppiella nova TaxID=334625 RepID=A0A7R9MEQ1_9ACAR|nr:unnamed protein product [Oppiella nova]CAG2176014.1 unnamed protein product [Oppiella nova]